MNENKTKFMVSRSRSSTRLKQSVSVANLYNFEVMDEFVNLGSVINKNHIISLKIKQRIMLRSTSEIKLSVEKQNPITSDSYTRCLGLWSRIQDHIASRGLVK